MTGPAAARYSLLSFDLDGTLVDTAGEIAEAANRTLADFRLPRQPLPVVTKLIGAGTRELMLGLLRELASSGAAVAASIDHEAALRRFASHYAATSGTSCRAYPGAEEALRRLAGAGIRLACVTNKERRYSEKVLAACGLGQAFDLLVAGDTLAVKKPDARVLQHAMHFFAAEAEATAHVGDSRTDVEAARNAGVAAWVVPYGYNAGVPIEQAHPDRIFQDLGAVATHVCTPA